MVRAILASLLAVGLASAASAQPVKNNQMVKGTVKSIDIKSGVLVVAQDVKNEKVDRQLSITENVEWTIKSGAETKVVTGKEGLALIAGKEGAGVQVKCDKDVNVQKVTVTLKK
jgi:hypothetical protein